jgi:membrane protein YdbS with pleckstrin-like domain
VLPRNRLQSVQLSASPFDRRYDMANVAIDTAGAGSLEDRVHIRLLPTQTARELARALYRSRVVAAPGTVAAVDD